MIYPVGATSQSVDFLLTDDTGLEVSGQIAATIVPISASLAGAHATTSISLSDLASETSAWSAGGLKERSDGKGIYRLDLPNTLFASAGCVFIRGEKSGQHVFCEPLNVGISVIASIGAGIVYSGALNPLTGAVTLYRGSDYLAVDNNQLDFINVPGNWPNLTAGTVVFEYKDGDGKLGTYPMTIVTPVGANQTVRLQLTNLQTSRLLGPNYTFSIIATLSDASVIVLATGSMLVLPQI